MTRTCIMLLLLLLCGVEGQNEALNSTVVGLHDATKFYVGAVTQNKAIPAVLKELGLDLTTITQLSIENFNLSELPAKIPNLLKYSAPYLVHIIIGFLLFVGLFICTFLLCCCRSMGCFCGKVGKKPKQGSDKGLIAFLFIALLGVTAALFMTGFAYTANAVHFSDNFSVKDNETNLLSDVISVIDDALQYIESLRNDTLGIFEKDAILQEINKLIDDVSVNILSLIDSSTGNFTRSLTTLTTRLLSLRSSLNTTISYMDKLKTSYAALQALRDQIKAKGDPATSSCANSDMQCQQAKTAYANLQIARDASFLPDLTPLQSAIDPFLDGDLGQILLKGPAGVFGNLTEQLKNGSSVVEVYLDQLRNTLSRPLPFDRSVVTNDSVFQQVSSILLIASPIIKIVLPVLSVFIFLLVLLNLFGVLTAICCSSSQPAIPEKSLIVASGISFPIGSIFALISLILFLVSAPLYGEFCMDLEKENESFYIQTADNVLETFLTPNLQNLTAIQDFKIKIDPKGAKFLQKGIFENCKDNGSLAKVVFDIVKINNDTATSFVDLTIKPLLDSALPDNSDLSSTSIFADSTFQAINATIDNINKVNLSLFDRIDELNNTITVPSPSEMKTLTQSAIIENKGDTAALTLLLNNELAQLETDAAATLATETEAKKAVNNMTDLITGGSEASLVKLMATMRDDLLDLKSNLGVNSTLIRGLKTSVLSYLSSKFAELLTSFQNKFLNSFRCRDAYDLLKSVIDFLSKLFLPLNSFWLTMGSYSILVILSAIFGLWGGALLVRQKPKMSEGDLPDEESVRRNRKNKSDREDRPKSKERRKRDERRRRRRRSGRVEPDNRYAPEAPPQFDDVYDNTPIVPPISVFPNGLYIEPPRINRVQAPKVRKSGQRSPSFLPPYDPFTNQNT